MLSRRGSRGSTTGRGAGSAPPPQRTLIAIRALIRRRKRPLIGEAHILVTGEDDANAVVNEHVVIRHLTAREGHQRFEGRTVRRGGQRGAGLSAVSALCRRENDRHLPQPAAVLVDIEQHGAACEAAIALAVE